MIRGRELASRSALVLASLVVGLAGLELGCRLIKGPRWLVEWPNLAVASVASYAAGRSAWTVYDRELGFVPRPDSVGEQGSFDGRSLRIEPAPAPADSRPVVAAGGSFTAGAEVSDGETWPASLEALTGRDIVNAGVSGYALDQAVLRVERVARALHPAAVIVGFTPENIWRTEMRRLWGAEKPYFTLDDHGQLVLHNVPVPRTSGTASVTQRLFGWSALVEQVMRRLSLPGEWGEWQNAWLTGSIRALPDGDGERIACALMRRLATLGVPVLAVAQYERETWELAATEQAQERRENQKVLECADAVGLATLDTFELIERAVRHDGLSSVYAGYHLSAAGNRLVAGSISDALKKLDLPRR